MPRPPPRLPRDEYDELNRRLSILRDNRSPLPPPKVPRRPRISRPDVEPDAEDVLNNILNRLVTLRSNKSK